MPGRPRAGEALRPDGRRPARNLLLLRVRGLGGKEGDSRAAEGQTDAGGEETGERRAFLRRVHCFGWRGSDVSRLVEGWGCGH